MGKVVAGGLVALLLGPACILLGLGALLSPAAQAENQCLISPASTSVDGTTPTLPETARVVVPLPAGTWVKTSGFGMRVHPITGEYKLHTGVDLAAPAGTHILAAADGRVAFAGPATGYGHLILIEHTVGGKRVATGYAHMYADGIHVKAGDTVTAGQYIADVGSDGYSTGSHLHFEVRPGGTDAAPVDPEPWLASNGAANVEGGSATSDAGCTKRWSGVAVHRRQSRRPCRRPDLGRTDHTSGPRTSSPRSRRTSPTPSGRAGRRARGSRSTHLAAPATAPSATRSAPQQAAMRSTTAGRSPTG